MNRLEQARAEIARRREITSGALTTVDYELRPIHPPTPWHPAHEVVRLLRTSRNRAWHIEENDPAHVLAVLAAADATLDRHAPESDVELDEDLPWCRICVDLVEGDGLHLPWPCSDAAAVLDLYAPEVPA